MHFKVSKLQRFPRDVDNVYLNRYILARKIFRKAVKYAQNKKIYDSLHKMNNSKNTHPKKNWSKIRHLRKSDSKRLFEVNGKQTSKDIANEFADNFNSLLNNPIIDRGTEDEVGSIPLPNASPNTIVLDDKDITEVISKLKVNKSADPSPSSQ